jgi:Flp pilus assembly protein TadD
LALKLRDRDSLDMKARCLSWHLKRWDKGAAAWSELIDLEPKNPWVRMERAVCYDELRRWKEALADHVSAVGMNTPSTPIFLHRRAVRHWAVQGDWDKAARDLRAARAMPAPPDAWWSRWWLSRDLALACAMAHDRSGYRQAAEQLRQTIGTVADEAQARWLVYSHVLAPGMVTKENGPALLAALVWIDEPMRTHLKAAILFRAGQVEEAARLFGQGPGEPGLQCLAAMAYHRLGKHEQARKLLDESRAWTRSQQTREPRLIFPTWWEDWVHVLALQREARLRLLDFDMEPSGGTFDAPQKVRIEGSDKVSIHWTLDGSTPTLQSPKYTDPIEVSKSSTLKVLVVPRGEPGIVVEARFSIEDERARASE